MMPRRTFLQASLAASALAASGVSCATGSGAAKAPAAPAKKMKILILGGTGFLGPALVEAARPRGHVLTLFNRGKTNPGLFTDIEQLHGDRDGKLDALRGRSWDVVIDDSGYVPRIVRQSAELLRPAVGRYVFISTISVYTDDTKPGADESAARQTLPPEAAGSEEVPKHYGALKALCEDVVAEVYGERRTTVRPGLIVGPRDPTDRFTYWPVRCARGGDILAPGTGDDPVQFIDVRDLAAWIVGLVERDTGGVFTAVGPAARLPMRAFLEDCQKAAGAPGRLVWVPGKFLEAHDVSPWSDMPVWIPDNGLAQLSAARAIAAGLTFRPVVDTARDTLAWWRTLPEARRSKLRSGISAEREADLLESFRKPG